jgi:putative FmdB family regulatory protein
MPTYDFECLDCGKVSEFTIRINAQAPPCPSCDSMKMKRLIATSFSVWRNGRPPNNDFQSDAGQEGS